MIEQRNKIRVILASYGISLAQVAAGARCHRSTVTRFFSGDIVTDRRGIMRVSRNLILKAQKEDSETEAILNDTNIQRITI